MSNHLRDLALFPLSPTICTYEQPYRLYKACPYYKGRFRGQVQYMKLVQTEVRPGVRGASLRRLLLPPMGSTAVKRRGSSTWFHHLIGWEGLLSYCASNKRLTIFKVVTSYGFGSFREDSLYAFAGVPKVVTWTSLLCERKLSLVTLSLGDQLSASRISWPSPLFARRQANGVCGSPAKGQSHTLEPLFQDFPVLTCVLTGGFEGGGAEVGTGLAPNTASSGSTSTLDVVPLDPLFSVVCTIGSIVLL